MNYKPKIYKTKFPKVLFLKFKELGLDYNDYLNISLKKRIKILRQNPEILSWVKIIKKKMKSNSPSIIIDVFDYFKKDRSDIDNFRLFNVFLSIFFGEMLSQDNNNKKVITVFDRDKTKTMKKGARYHQTHEGGSIHTDNVNIPEYWDFLFFSCISQAPKGGHSLLVDGDIVYKTLKKKFADDLKILEQKFWFEKRGLTNELFKSPIIFKDKNKIKYRYLRPYLEAAHLRSGSPLNKSQVKSLNTLDKILENPKFQFKFKIKKFQILVTQDFRILHGRTSFKDYPKSVDLDAFNKNLGHKLKRTMDRMWIKEV